MNNIIKNRLFKDKVLSPMILRLNKINNEGCQIFHNLSYKDIKNRLQIEKRGRFTLTDSYCVSTGKYTGRSPQDRYIVDSSVSNKDINWGSVNQNIEESKFNKLYNLVTDYYNNVNNVYIFDGFCGNSSEKHIRFLTEHAWQHNFVKNMFIRPDEEKSLELCGKDPDFTMINASGLEIDSEIVSELNLNSEAFVILHIDKKIGIIGGTSYAGEMKKSIFSLMNYWLPKDNILTMHCSANIGDNNETALFFGLSGTGKTTLSAVPNRYLIGDDEHGWNNEGIFNLEGGCYAKTLNLDPNAEPEIFGAIKEKSILENVFVEKEGKVNYFNNSITDNGRVSYPIFHISNYCQEKVLNHPNNIIFLTCDAFGILPPVSKLNNEEAMYHFLSGYTAKVAGTERGIVEPVATFSACYGEPFLPLHPYRYAELLNEKINKYDSNVYLVNTGWYKGGYGVGERMKISLTRKCIDAILDNSILENEFEKIPIFNLLIPKVIDGVDNSILNPCNSWNSKKEYYKSSEKLAQMFINNFEKYSNHNDMKKLIDSGPQF